MQENAETEELEEIHPRPQLTRTQWMNLKGAWGFAYDDTACGLNEEWQEREDIYTQTIQVPFPPESSASGIGETGFHPIVWYRRTFQVPPEYSGKQLLLHCGAIDYCAQVWVNRQLVATHEGGQTPFTANITTALGTDTQQVIVIRAEDNPLDLAQPRGKQDWQEQPHAIWYHRTTGIWQPVWLEPVAATYITQLRWTPDLDTNQLGVQITLQRQAKVPLRVRVQLSYREDILSDDIYTMQEAVVKRQITFDEAALMNRDRLLWSPEQPTLINATLTVLADDEIVDEVQSYVGWRSVGVEHGHFLLNNRPYYLRFVLEQGYWPQSHLAAPSTTEMLHEIERAKELGFNGVRIHQKVEDPRFLYYCDRLGLLVWSEMANAYTFSPAAVERFTREWLEVVERNYNHPCIVAWVPLNESWGILNVAHDPAQRHYVQALYHLTKALDPTRPTIGNDGWEHTVSDIYGIHDYSFDGSTLLERYGSLEAVAHTMRNVQPGRRVLLLQGFHHADEPIMITEFGGISYQPAPDTAWFGYGTVTNRADFLAKYRELVDAILDCPAIAGFCYTQLTDTEQETNGLLTANREPKLDPAQVRAITQRRNRQ